MLDSLHIVCPHCARINRIPQQRLAEAPKCGQCHEALFTGQPLELTADGLRRHIDSNQVPVLVDFWAPWCGPCQSMAPHYAAAARQLEPHVRLVKVNIDAEPALAAELGIRSVPTLLLFKAGRELTRQSGAMPQADIVRWARSHG